MLFFGMKYFEQFPVQGGEGGGEGGEASDEVVDVVGGKGPVDAAGVCKNFGSVLKGRVGGLRFSFECAGGETFDGLYEEAGSYLFHPVVYVACRVFFSDGEAVL